MSETGSSGSKSLRNGAQRRLRERKQRKLYMEEWALGDDDGEGSRGFSVAEKLESAKFAQPGIVKEIRGADLNVGYLQRVGMNVPLLIREKSGLGIRMPDPNEFTVNDVRLCVGSRRLVDVMDVNTQKNIQMTMKEWQHYYESQQKERLLNVISLEFSHTRLDQYVQSPDIVRQIDWADIVWPKQLKDAQRDPTNCMGEMMYPKVQKYCLMSVRNCYTDFHIDFGGTSVWYHILKGSKVFWLIPPTDRNLQLYERWVLSGKQSDVFFGDTVEKCARVYLTAGNTFFIPSGWIHAVYTPEDSLVFGGNFLHSFGIIKQLKTVHVEDATRVPQKFRYPFFTEMLWYVLARYVHTLLGHSHLYGEQSASELEMSARPHVHLTHYELFGLKEIVMYLYDLPPQKKNVPELVRDPVLLIKDVRNLVERHCRDKMDMACTGMSVLLPQGENQPKWQPYVRARVKQEIKMEIARRNAEIICEQKALQAANQADNPDNSTINSTIASLSNCTMDGKVIEIKKDFTENSHTTSNENTETGLFTSPTEFLKYRPPKKMHLANAVAAAASVGNGSPVVSSTTANNGNSNSNASSSSISNNNNNTNNNNNKNNNNSIIKIELAASTAATSQTSVNNRSECYSPPSSTTSLMHNQDMLKFSPTTTGMGQPRRRRTRCKVCAACQRNDCGECSFCLDMVKFGGPGRAKQTCMMRQCLAPMLPITAQCAHCHLDGWRQMPVAPQTKQFTTQEGPSALMECSVCYEITHPDCALQKLTGSAGKGIVNEDLPNSWECPNCCYSGKNNDYKPRHFRARQKFSEVRRINTTGTESGGEGVPYYDFILTSESEMETNCASNNTVRQLSKRAHQKSGGGEVKSERSNSEYGEKSKRRKSDDDQSLGGSSRQDSIDANASADCSHSNSNTSHNGITTQLSASSASLNPVIATETVIKRKKSSIRSQLAQQMLNSSTRVLKKPQYVVRPAGNASNNSSHAYTAYSTSTNLAMEPYLLKLVFRHLPPEALVTCSAVCKGWANVAVDPDLWKNMNVAEHKMTANLLTAIVRRQPEQLVLDWTQIAKRQLVWLVSRLPALKQLSMQNCPIQAVQALHTCLCPPLQYLDLSFVSSLNDAAIRDILAPPKDSRPGLTDSKSRLRDLKTFKLAGTDISDVALRYITQTLITLIHLDLSSCQRITDAGVAQIGTSVKARATLIELNLSGCRLVTEQSLEYLSKCEQLMLLDLRHVPQVSTQAVIKFAAKSKHDLCVKDIKLVERRHIHTTTTTAAITTMGREGGSSNCLSATNRWHE